MQKDLLKDEFNKISEMLGRDKENKLLDNES